MRTWDTHTENMCLNAYPLTNISTHKHTLTPSCPHIICMQYHTCIIPLGIWSNMFCRSSDRRGLFGPASIAATSAWAAISSFGTLTFAFLSQMVAGEGEREGDFWYWPPSCCSDLCWACVEGTSSEFGLFGKGHGSAAALTPTDTGTAGRLLLLLKSREDPSSSAVSAPSG